jgi:ATP-dependent Clp protease protease subunit
VVDLIDVKAKADNEADILIYGDIGESFWSEDTVTAKKFAKDLKAVGNVSKINLFINSGGGNIFEAQAIFSMLKRFNAYKTVYIDGLAASAASVIAMAGDKITMPANAMIMIHKAWAAQGGNADDMRKLADTLDQVDSCIAETYQAKTGKAKDEIMELLSAETWLTAGEALSNGFVDEIEQEVKIAASIDGNLLSFGDIKVDTTTFKNFKPDTIETYREPAKVEPVAIADPEPKGLKEQSKKFHELRSKIYDYKEDK